MPGIIEDWRNVGLPKPDSGPGIAHTPENVADENYRKPAYSRPLQDGPDALFGATEPFETVLHEKVWHRRAQELHMQGYSQPEVASMLGKSVKQTQLVLRQPWAQERMNNRMQEDASVQIKKFLEEECLPSLVAIKEVRDSISESVRTSDRLNAAQYLTDRFLGKATQPISTIDQKPPVELTSDELNTEVQSIVAGMATAAGDPQKSQ